MNQLAAGWELNPGVKSGVYLSTSTNELPTNSSTDFKYSTQNNFVEDKAVSGLTFTASECKLTVDVDSIWLIRCYSSFYIPGFGNTGIISFGVDLNGDLLAVDPITDYGNFLESPIIDIGGFGYGVITVERRLEVTAGNHIRPVGAARSPADAAFLVNANFDHFVMIAQREG